MIGIPRSIRSLDEALLNRVFQSAVDRLRNLPEARHWFASAIVDLSAGFCIAAAIIIAQRAGSMAKGVFDCLTPLCSLVCGRYLIFRDRRWHRLEASLGPKRRNPNRESLLPYRVVMLLLGLLACIPTGAVATGRLDLIVDVSIWSLCLSGYVLSCDDPRPEKRLVVAKAVFHFPR